MASRIDVVRKALSYDGVGDGEGYPGKSNPADAILGRPNEFWCADFITAVFYECGLPLPLMQHGMKGKQTGAAYCPDIVHYDGAYPLIDVKHAQPADLLLFDWNEDGIADHIELVRKVQSGQVISIGGDSGPSNVNAYRGQGGVHQHSWHADTPLIRWVVDSSRLVHFSEPQRPHTQPARTTPSWYSRVLSYTEGEKMLYGSDVRTVQSKLGVVSDGWYGPDTKAAVESYQQARGLSVDGVVGPETAGALGD